METRRKAIRQQQPNQHSKHRGGAIVLKRRAQSTTGSTAPHVIHRLLEKDAIKFKFKYTVELSRG
jgi:hypothetical protein